MNAGADDALLARVKRYCMIEHDEEDGLINQLILAGQEYLASAGIPAQEGGRYELVLSALVLHWHDNRAAACGAEAPFSVRALINQLKFEHYGGRPDGCGTNAGSY